MTGWRELPRDVLRVAGPDATDFLQGQLSQEVSALSLPQGASAWSLLLQPQGRVDALVRVGRTGPDELHIDVDRGWGDRVRARLERFKLRVKAEIELVEWRCIAVRGPEAEKVTADVDGWLRRPADWPGLDGVDLVGPDVVPPPGLPEWDEATFEAERIAAGVPVNGAELDERTIPAEAGPALIERAVSFTKGCYTGQELVARIDSRGGNVPRHLRGVRVVGTALPAPGASVEVEGREVGRVTSAARSRRLGAIALAYVGRAVEPPAEAELTWPGGQAPARIEALPLLS